MVRRSYALAVSVLSILAFAGCRGGIDPERQPGGMLSFNAKIISDGGGIVTEPKSAELKSVDGQYTIPLNCSVSDGIGESCGETVVDCGTKGERLNTGSSIAPLENWTEKVGGRFYVAAFNDDASRFIPKAASSGDQPQFEEVRYANGQWQILGKAYTWTGIDEKKFFAYANLPEDVDGVCKTSVTCTDNTKITLSYDVVPSDASKQNDILLGYYKGKGKYDEEKKRGGIAEIDFGHPLTAVRFKKGTMEGVSSISFKSITVSGVYAKGVVAYDGEVFTWSGVDGSQSVTMTPKSPATELPVSADDIIGESFLLIPQDLSEKNISITVAAVINGMETSLLGSREQNSWKPGKTNTYTLGYDARTYDYKFELQNPDDATQVYSNPASNESREIPMVSKKVPDGGDPLNHKYWIKSYQIGLADPVTVDGESFVAGGLSVSAGAEELTVTALKKDLTSSHAFWANTAGRTDRPEWSPADWSTSTSSSPVDLSKYNYATDATDESMTTANSYVIRHAGTYMLPLVYGNAVKNGSENRSAFENESGGLPVFKNHLDADITSGFIENNSGCEAASTAVIWQDNAIVVKDLAIVGDEAGTYDCSNVRYLKFTVDPDTVCQNNAVIAVKDATGKVIWSWHIWTTNNPDVIGEPISVTGFSGTTRSVFRPLSVGCIDANKYFDSEDVTVILEQETSGRTLSVKITQKGATAGRARVLYYQFARKDPEVDPNHTPVFGAFSYNSSKTTFGTAIQTPATHYGSSAGFSRYYDNLWSNVKTVYDPSPKYYVIPPLDTFSGFSKTGAKGAVNGPEGQNWSEQGGVFFYTAPGGGPDRETIFMPLTEYISSGGWYFGSPMGNVSYWHQSSGLNNYSFWAQAGSVTPNSSSSSGCGMAVRPVLDSSL